MTGDGIEDFFKAVDASREEYERRVNRGPGYDVFSHAAGNTSQSLSGHGRLGINPYET